MHKGIGRGKERKMEMLPAEKKILQKCFIINAFPTAKHQMKLNSGG